MVLVASRDLPGGTVLQPGDLTRAGFAPDSVPAGTVPSAGAVGRTTAIPLRRGEPITDVRLLAAPLLADYPGMVAAPVRIGDPDAVRLLHVGDVVDVIGADPQTGSATTVADDAPVIAIPTPSERTTGLEAGTVSGALVVLAVPDRTAHALAGAGVSSYLSVVLNR